ncbi:MAG: glutamate mutase L [Candidatus Ozemobacteraceae bacterium]
MTVPRKELIQSILATDCGSTTTKAVLFEKREGVFRLIARGEAPTTVEAPVEDVTRGVLHAIAEIQELVGRKLLTEDGGEIIKPRKGNTGVDLYVSTSSAGGGLQMMVAGVVKTMSGESATRAALGAGAVVMDVLAANDGRLPYEKIRRIRQLRPDMILLSGGVDGGTVSHVVEMAELVAAASPKARLGVDHRLPILYAGNKDARELVRERLSNDTREPVGMKTTNGTRDFVQERSNDEVHELAREGAGKDVGSGIALDFAENLRPTMERENLMPSRHKIQHLFLEHVMSHAPGYPRLMKMTDVDIMPTPGAVGDIMQLIAKRRKQNTLGVDIGGATTDVFSVFGGTYNKSVSANYGMSYSITNVFADAGYENILRWVPFDIDERELRNRIANKMIRPTTIPALLEELVIEQACAREALRMSFEQHRMLAVGLKGIQQERSVGDVFAQTQTGASLVDMRALDILIGSGGVLSHAPRRQQAALMLIDAFQPEGITRLAVDSIFMMPQLGVLAKVYEEAALSVFEKDCLVQIGTCIAPIGQLKNGRPALEINISHADGTSSASSLAFGELSVVPLPVGQTMTVRVKPARGLDVGAGDGREHTFEASGGSVGLIFDTRGRPLALPQEKPERMHLLKKWNLAMNMYPQEGVYTGKAPGMARVLPVNPQEGVYTGKAPGMARVLPVNPQKGMNPEMKAKDK